MGKQLNLAFRRALSDAPASMRELARAAGLNHSTLSKVWTGDRGLTLNVARAVAAALREWEARSGSLAEAIERAADAAEREE